MTPVIATSVTVEPARLPLEGERAADRADGVLAARSRAASASATVSATRRYFAARVHLDRDAALGPKTCPGRASVAVASMSAVAPVGASTSWPDAPAIVT